MSYWLTSEGEGMPCFPLPPDNSHATLRPLTHSYEQSRDGHPEVTEHTCLGC